MKLDRSRPYQPRATDVLRPTEKPKQPFDLRRQFPTLPEDYAEQVLGDMDISGEDLTKQYAYILSLAEYFGRAENFMEGVGRNIFEENAHDALKEYSNDDLNTSDTEDDNWFNVIALVRAYNQIFPGQPRELQLTDEAFSRHLSWEVNSWDSAKLSLQVEMAIELVILRPDLRAKVSATITDDEVFRALWVGRYKMVQAGGWDYALKGLAEMTLVWPQARHFFKFEPAELESLVRKGLKKKPSRDARLRLLWAVAVLTSEQAWIDEQGKVHLQAAALSELDQPPSLPPRDLVV